MGIGLILWTHYKKSHMNTCIHALCVDMLGPFKDLLQNQNMNTHMQSHLRFWKQLERKCKREAWTHNGRWLRGEFVMDLGLMWLSRFPWVVSLWWSLKRTRDKLVLVEGILHQCWCSWWGSRPKGWRKKKEHGWLVAYLYSSMILQMLESFLVQFLPLDHRGVERNCERSWLGFLETHGCNEENPRESWEM